MNYTVEHMSILDWAQAYSGPPFHACLMDPPAGIAFMGKKWDHDHGGRDQWIDTFSKNFAAILRHLLPGAGCFCWALPRTSHWTATALENAGFEILDINVHLFSQGFPKSHNISLALDKKAGAKREVVGPPPYTRGKTQQKYNDTRKVSWDCEAQPVTANATEAAKSWDGYGTALKPASEHWIRCRKPFAGTVADNCLINGCGALNIDSSRVGAEGEIIAQSGEKVDMARSAIHAGYDRPNATMFRTGKPKERGGPSNSLGRWPANVTTDGSPVILKHFPDAPGQLADVSDSAPSKKTANVYGAMNRVGEASADSDNTGEVGFKMKPGARRLDTGSAARFFTQCPPSELDGITPWLYCAKASAKERHSGMGDKRNSGPCVKPITLTTHFSKLLLPPARYAPRRCICPFLGTASEAIGALIAGFEEVVGIEQDAEYVEIARARLQHWHEKIAAEHYEEF